MATAPIVPSFLAHLSTLGIRQKDVARTLGVTEGQVSRLRSGDRSLQVDDYRGLLARLCQDYPTCREQLAEAAVAPILEGTGLQLRLVVEPPPAAPAAGNVFYLNERRARMAA